MRISDWSSDVCSSDLLAGFAVLRQRRQIHRARLAFELRDRVELAADLEDRREIVGVGDRRRTVGLEDRRVAVVDDLAEGVEVGAAAARSEEHTSELQSLMRISYAVFCL